MHIGKLKYIIVFTGILSVSTAAAQGHIEIQQKWLYRSLFNPAATGNSNALELYGVAREQWAGIDGAPSTQLLYGHYFFPSVNSGVGLGVTNESIGLYHTLDLKASYAYHIPLSDEFTLSLGLSAIVTRTSRDAPVFDIPVDDMPPFKPRTDVNFDAGVELRNSWLKFGISALRLVETADNAIVDDFNNPVSYRSFMIYAMGRFKIDENIDLSPVVAGTLDHGAINGETGVMVHYKRYGNPSSQLQRLNYEKYDFLWAGVFVHAYGDVSAMAGISITEQWRLGYAYSYSFQYRSELPPSTHEISLSWRFFPASGERGSRYYRCVDC